MRKIFVKARLSYELLNVSSSIFYGVQIHDARLPYIFSAALRDALSSANLKRLTASGVSSVRLAP